MYHVNNNIHLDVTLGDFKSDVGSLNFGRLLMTSNVFGALPLFQLEFSDTGGELKRYCNIKDGMPVTIHLGKTKEAQKKYSFRLFNNREATNGQYRVYQLTGYLDMPSFFSASTVSSYKDTTANVIKKIAEAAGAEQIEVDTTSDSQVWFQANKRNWQFIRYLSERGFIDAGSIMLTATRYDKTFLYKDFNRISGSTFTMAYNPTENEAQIVDHRVLELSGGPNMSRGYGDTLMQQSLEDQAPVQHKDIQIDPRSSQVAVNSDIKGMTDRGRIDFTPPHFKDQAHDNYFKALHQNTRGAFMNSAHIDVLTPLQLDDLDLLMPVKARLQNVNQNADSAEAVRDGDYVVIGKDILVQGLNYAERYRLARAGTNPQAK